MGILVFMGWYSSQYICDGSRIYIQCTSRRFEYESQKKTTFTDNFFL